MAAARASDASRGLGISLSPRLRVTINWTCSLVAWPLPFAVMRNTTDQAWLMNINEPPWLMQGLTQSLPTTGNPKPS